MNGNEQTVYGVYDTRDYYVDKLVNDRLYADRDAATEAQEMLVTAEAKRLGCDPKLVAPSFEVEEHTLVLGRAGAVVGGHDDVSE